MIKHKYLRNTHLTVSKDIHKSGKLYLNEDGEINGELSEDIEKMLLKHPDYIEVKLAETDPPGVKPDDEGFSAAIGNVPFEPTSDKPGNTDENSSLDGEGEQLEAKSDNTDENSDDNNETEEVTGDLDKKDVRRNKKKGK